MSRESKDGKRVERAGVNHPSQPERLMNKHLPIHLSGQEEGPGPRALMNITIRLSPCFSILEAYNYGLARPVNENIERTHKR